MKLVLEPMDVDGGPLVCEGPELLVGRGIRELREDAPGAALLDIEARFPMVSREHARLRRDKDAWAVENLGKHGTTVNDEAVRAPRVLAEGDVLRFGREGPRYVVRLRAGATGAELRRCPACREIVPREEVERHERECAVLHPPSRGKSKAPVFTFGPLRSGKRNLLVLADLSGGTDLSLAGPALIDAFQDPSIRFNVLGFGGARPELWRGPSGRLHAATEESRAEARAWIRARSPAGKPRLGEALSKVAEFKDVEALVLLVAGATEEVAERLPLEIHAVGLGPLYYAESRAQEALRDLAERHGGGFFAIASRAP